MTACDGPALRAAFEAAAARLTAEAPAVNALNVFPVPDGDTGTNMSLTLEAMVKEVAQRAPEGAGPVAQALAYGALMGARGNSGVILSQILRGMARRLQGLEAVDATAWANALQEGAATAYKGVSQPVEGTMLTVIREAAAAAVAAAGEGVDLLAVMERTVAAARAAVARTPELLAVLREAGVVDAGGQGLLIVLEAVLASWRGEEPAAAGTAAPAAGPKLDALEGEFGYCTEFLVEGEGLDLDDLRRAMGALGDSLLVVGDERIARVHVHTRDPGAALSYATARGAVRGIKIDNMQDQNERFKAEQRDRAEGVETVATALAIAEREAERDLAADRTAVVAVAAGDGFAALFRSLGATVVAGGQTMNPSCQELVAAVERLPAESVVILPNNRNVILTANQVRELTKKPVAVVPTETLPQGVAAMLSFNSERTLAENAAALEAAAAAVATIEVTRAVRDARVDGTPVAAGQAIAVGAGGLLAAGTSEREVVLAALAKLDPDRRELVTFYFGEGIAEADAHILAAAVKAAHPNLETEVVRGGQPHYSYIVSVE